MKGWVEYRCSVATSTRHHDTSLHVVSSWWTLSVSQCQVQFHGIVLHWGVSRSRHSTVHTQTHSTWWYFTR